MIAKSHLFVLEKKTKKPVDDRVGPEEVKVDMPIRNVDNPKKNRDKPNIQSGQVNLKLSR